MVPSAASPKATNATDCRGRTAISGATAGAAVQRGRCTCASGCTRTPSDGSERRSADVRATSPRRTSDEGWRRDDLQRVRQVTARRGRPRHRANLCPPWAHLHRAIRATTDASAERVLLRGVGAGNGRGSRVSNVHPVFVPILDGLCPSDALEGDFSPRSPGLLPASTYDEKLTRTPARSALFHRNEVKS